MTVPASADMTARMRLSIVTSTYRGDLERCRLLCESIDRHVTGMERHYLLVEDADAALFAPFASERRIIVPESAILPRWLRPFADPLDRRRRLWVHPFGLPLRGWHVQQLRRMAVASILDEDVMVSCDSDVVFVKPFDLSRFVSGQAVRFYRRPAARHDVAERFQHEHETWSRRAGTLLGIDAPATTATGYITTLVAWRLDTLRAMNARIAAVSGRSALRALVRNRALSECTIYGRFVDEVENRPDRHAAAESSLCRVYWTGEAMTLAELQRFVEGLSAEEAAICVQSFTATDPALIRSVAGLR